MREVPLYGNSDGDWQSEAWDNAGGGGTRHGGDPLGPFGCEEDFFSSQIL